MLRRDLRKLGSRDRAIVRRQLATFLAWAVRHGCDRADLIGRKATKLGLLQAETATQNELARIADLGAFLFFGIGTSFDLGTVPIVIRELPWSAGVIALANVHEAIEFFLRGGMRGGGWLASSELTVDDLAK